MKLQTPRLPVPFNTHSTCSYQTTCPNIFFFFVVVVFASRFPQHLQRAPHLSEPTAHHRGAAVLTFPVRTPKHSSGTAWGSSFVLFFCFFLILKYFLNCSSSCQRTTIITCGRAKIRCVSQLRAHRSRSRVAPVSHASPDNTGRVNNTRACRRSRSHRESIMFI